MMHDLHGIAAGAQLDGLERAVQRARFRHGGVNPPLRVTGLVLLTVLVGIIGLAWAVPLASAT